MNPLLLTGLANLWSFRHELCYVSLTFVLILLLPVLAVATFTNTGFNVISNKLATVTVNNHTIQIRNPSTGVVTKEITTPTEWPANGVVTLEFGESDLPYQPFHTGIDIAGKIGDPITAFMDGKVIYAGEINWGYGKHIIIDNGNNITSLYGHLSSINVAKGDDVHAGQVIGYEGQTGWATGPHLHFQVNVFGIPVNPLTFLPGNP
ncbi:MAG: M23 family metallopeptidase [Candidatus Levyibacteriota bacterium]